MVSSKNVSELSNRDSTEKSQIWFFGVVWVG